ncbi:MAG TPA: glycosyltransferase family 9 protein, partial [Pseudomonadaceae bacterium]|nr:glycosyltransferase family 9 protein [Pseudomonadaceae bacterium]
HCQQRGISFAVVIDKRYVPLLQHAFAGIELIAYPRSAIAAARSWKKAAAYLACLRRIRALRADIAFNIEEDSVSHRLTQLSGARFKLGCNAVRHRYGYDHVVPVEINQRSAGEAHRWYGFYELFHYLGLEHSKPSYVKLAPAPLSAERQQALQARGLDATRSLAVLHSGATKDYKLWPAAHFASLIKLLDQEGHQVALIGAGKDEANIKAILALLEPPLAERVVNLLNALALDELSSLLARASLAVGNDSGPAHLAAALGIPGVVVFGPTRADIWSPLSERVTVLQDRSVCHAQCTRHHCLQAYFCLQNIQPELVMNRLPKNTAATC